MCPYKTIVVLQPQEWSPLQSTHYKQPVTMCITTTQKSKQSLQGFAGEVGNCTPLKASFKSEKRNKVFNFSCSASHVLSATVLHMTQYSTLYLIDWSTALLQHQTRSKPDNSSSFRPIIWTTHWRDEDSGTLQQPGRVTALRASTRVFVASNKSCWTTHCSTSQEAE